jgi:hypothetical protein
VFALAEGTDNPCSTAVMILLQLSSAQCRSRHGHLFRLKTVVSGTHDLAIGSRNGFLVGIQKAGFGLDVIRMYCLRIPTCCEYRHECCCLASPTAIQRNSHSLDATRRSRTAAGSSRSFALRLRLLCVCSWSMAVALTLSSLISTALVSSVAPHPPSQT